MEGCVKPRPLLGLDPRTVQPVASCFKVTAHSVINMASVNRNQYEKILGHAKYLLINKVHVQLVGIKCKEPILIYCTEHVQF